MQSPSSYFRVAFTSAALTVLCATALHAQDMTQRDSAGVRIVTITRLDTLKRAPELKTSLIAQIGGSTRGPEYEFTNYFPGFIMRDGTIALAARSDVRFFDASGTFVRSVGHAGEGPGEFNSIIALCDVQNGSLLVHADARFTLLDKSGKVQWIGNSAPTLRGCLSDGSLLVLGAERSNILPPTASDRMLLVGADTGGARTRYARVSMEPAPRALGDIALIRSNIAGPTTSRVTSTGARVLVVNSRPFRTTPSIVAGGDHVCAGDATSFEVRCRDVRTDATMILRIQRAPHRVTEEHKRFYIDDAVSLFAGEERASRIREIEAGGFPAVLPPYDRMLCDDAGRIWIKDVALGAALQQWNVFRSSGEHVGTVHFPADLVLINIAHNRVLARNRDADGFVVAKVYSLGGS